jgi:FkbM family methyltransferase
MRGNIFLQLLHAPDRKNRLRQEVSKNRRRIARLFTRAAAPSSKHFKLVSCQGLDLLLDPSSLVDFHFLNSGYWEKEQLDIMTSAILDEPDRASSIFLDIGAYWGLYGLKAHQSGISEVHFFEPDPRNRAQLYTQLFLNNLQSAVHVHEFAASDHLGTMQFRRSETIKGGNRGHAGRADFDKSDGFCVPCKPIDSEIGFKNRTIFCKIDVEGSELQVLNGMTNLIKNNKVFIQVETFEDNIDRVRECASRLGLTFLKRVGVDDFHCNFTPKNAANT